MQKRKTKARAGSKGRYAYPKSIRDKAKALAKRRAEAKRLRTIVNHAPMTGAEVFPDLQGSLV